MIQVPKDHAVHKDRKVSAVLKDRQGPGGDGSPDGPDQVRAKLIQLMVPAQDADRFMYRQCRVRPNCSTVLDRLRTVDGPGSGVNADREMISTQRLSYGLA